MSVFRETGAGEHYFAMRGVDFLGYITKIDVSLGHGGVREIVEVVTDGSFLEDQLRDLSRCPCAMEVDGMAFRGIIEHWRWDTGQRMFTITLRVTANVCDEQIEEEEPLENTGMKTKNIAALLIEECKTISVVFQGESKGYTYKTVEDFEEGDHAVIIAPSGSYKVVKVDRVDKVPQIDVDSSLDYQWIVCKVEKQARLELMEREEKFSQNLLEHQQTSVRKNARAMLEEKLGLEDNSLAGAIEDLNKSS